MSEINLFKDLDDLAEVTRFFVTLAQRLPAKFGDEEDLTTLAHTLLIPAPRTLRAATITKNDNPNFDGLSRIDVTLPPVKPGDGNTGVTAIKRCFTVCKVVNKVNICITVCVSIGLTEATITGTLTIGW